MGLFIGSGFGENQNPGTSPMKRDVFGHKKENTCK
jgi:hypothetical protein